MRLALTLSLAANLVAVAAFGYYVHRRGGPRYVIERLGLVQVIAEPNAEQIALGEAQAQAKVRGAETIFIGDSIIMRLPVCEAFGRVKNFGIAGELSDGVLQRLDDVLPRQPNQLFVQAGTNDLLRGVPIAEIIENFRKIIDAVAQRSPTTELVLINVLPVHRIARADVDHDRKIESIPKLNAAIAELAAEAGVTVVDAYAPFADVDGELHRSLSIDGTHLNPEGYRVLLDRLEPHVRTATVAR